MRLFDRYIARLMVRPLAATLLIATMLLLLDRMQRLFTLVVNEGGPAWLAWTMLANTVPGYISLGLTVALLLSIVLTLRQLAITSELDVLRGSGLSCFRLLRVPYGYALLLAVANLAVIGFIQPHARYSNEALRYDLQSGALGAAIDPGEFHAFGDRRTLHMDAIGADRRTLEGVFLESQDERGSEISVNARSAQVLASADGEALVLRLRDGILVSRGAVGATPRTLRFSSHDLRLPLPEIAQFRNRGTGRAEEFTLPELATRRGETRLPAIERRQANAELQFRLVELATMFVVPLLALALGVPPKRSTSAIGVFASVLVLIVWFKIDQYGAQAIASGRAGAIAALWMPLAVLGAGSGWMAYRFDRRLGSQPLAAIERRAKRLIATVRRGRGGASRQGESA